MLKKELQLLKNDAQSIEKYAREKYMMKKDNEDLLSLPPSKNGIICPRGSNNVPNQPFM